MQQRKWYACSFHHSATGSSLSVQKTLSRTEKKKKKKSPQTVIIKDLIIQPENPPKPESSISDHFSVEVYLTDMNGIHL